MKLLSTIAAVLISISALSQDLIEYDNGTFTHNGEELSMQQIDDLTLLHKAGRGNVRRGKWNIEMHKDILLRSANNSVNLIGGAATGYFGGIGVLVSGLVLANGNTLSGPTAVLLGATTGLCVVSYKAFSSIVLSKEMYLPKRDYQFKKVAIKINHAIKAANQ